MLTPHEVLFRARKGRKNMAKAYLSVRKKHGWKAVGKLWREVEELRRKAYAPGGDAHKARKPEPVGLQALLGDGSSTDSTDTGQMYVVHKRNDPLQKVTAVRR